MANTTNPELTVETGFLIYETWWEEFEDMYADEPQLALEFILALGRYNFYGKEYDGTVSEIRRQMKSKMRTIDEQRIRYKQSVGGGKTYNRVPDDKIIDAVVSGRFRSKAEIGRQFGITGQSVGQRMAKLGLTLGMTRKEYEAKLASQNAPISENSSLSFETFETSKTESETKRNESNPTITFTFERNEKFSENETPASRRSKLVE